MKSKNWTAFATAFALALSAAQIVPSERAENTQNDSRIQAELANSLSKSNFKDVRACTNGIASLTGTVGIFDDKADAEKKARKLKSLSAVRDDIQVGGPSVPDRDLQSKLLGKIQSDRIGYGTTALNASSVSTQNGVVSLGGSAYGPTVFSTLPLIFLIDLRLPDQGCW